MEYWTDRKLTWFANYLKSFPAHSFQAFSVAKWMHENAIDVPMEMPSVMEEVFGGQAIKEKEKAIDFEHRPGEDEDEWFSRINQDMDRRTQETIEAKKLNKLAAKDRGLFISLPRQQREFMIKTLIDALEVRDEADPVNEEQTVVSLKALFDRIGFGEDERCLSEFFLCMAGRDSITPFNALISRMTPLTENDANKHVARFLNMPVNNVQHVLAADKPLRKAAFLTSPERGGNVVPYVVSAPITAILNEPNMHPDAMVDQLIGTVITTPRDFDRDFDFLGEKGKAIYETAAGMLEQGIKSGKGNILLYGGGGSGKTTLAAVIAKKLGYAIYDVGQLLPRSYSLKEGRSRYDKEEEPGRLEQLNAFLLASFLVGRLNKKAILHVGEAEGMFRDPNDYRFQGGGLKNHLQAALDASSALSFMTTNRIDLIAESTIRRMLPVFHIPAMPWSKRADVILENARAANLTLSFDAAAGLARTFPELSPGMLEYTVQATGLRRDLKKAREPKVIDALQLVFSETVRGIHGGSVPKRTPLSVTGFNPALMNLGCSLKDFANSLKVGLKKQPGFSLCLVGPQGAGKRSSALWLCDRLGISPMQVPFQELLNEKVGNRLDVNKLANVMERAEADGSALVISGADVLFDEQFRLIRGETDLFDSVTCPMIVLADTPYDVSSDKIARFTFALRAGYLLPSQQATAFRDIIGMPLPKDMKLPLQLTPDDFARVRKQMDLIGGKNPQPETAITLLRNVRQASQQRKDFMGFTGGNMPNPA